MQVIIDYFLFVTNKIISILDTMKLPGSSSILYYLLGAIIIGFIIRLVKGGSTEFSNSMNYSNGTIIRSGISSYKMKNNARKEQLVEQHNKARRFNPDLKDIYW